ncbi:hypothetical protein NQ318_005639 [Aromia moschata]|uniref:F-box domain-containing protein n=1 Tax=Aromia moschata TaxID=1265417 RepID=A0AAV8XXS9_9CUCU|nr:hypothetical protein NQ318_005639 [Aromia moschata]
MENYLQNLSYGYNTLLYVFQYLKVQDLLRAGCVCTMWRDIASHPMLWRTVRMKNSQAIEKVDTLRRIELCRCPASVVEKLAVSNPQLEVINAVTIKCESMDLEPLNSLTNIKELRLKSTGGLTLTSNIDSLKDMKQMKHLSLTSIRDLNTMNLAVIAGLTNLESLDLGECTDFPRNFGSDILVKLERLEKLRLEKGQGNCHTFEILDAVKDMKHLEQLELVNFDIKAGFDKALGSCQNIKKLLIIPTYISQSATTNHMVLGGVLRLQKTLSHFVWGVTLELLRVTELFVDQCEEPEKKEKKEKKPVGNGDSIPVLKPVPLLNERERDPARPRSATGRDPAPAQLAEAVVAEFTDDACENTENTISRHLAAEHNGFGELVVVCFVYSFVIVLKIKAYFSHLMMSTWLVVKYAHFILEVEYAIKMIIDVVLGLLVQTSLVCSDIDLKGFCMAREERLGGLVLRTTTEDDGSADDCDEQEDGEEHPVEDDGRLLPLKLGQLLPVLLGQPLLVPVDAGVHLVQDADDLIFKDVCNQ